jgi:hypothetical protein
MKTKPSSKSEENLKQSFGKPGFDDTDVLKLQNLTPSPSKTDKQHFEICVEKS